MSTLSPPTLSRSTRRAVRTADGCHASWPPPPPLAEVLELVLNTVLAAAGAAAAGASSAGSGAGSDAGDR